MSHANARKRIAKRLAAQREWVERDRSFHANNLVEIERLLGDVSLSGLVSLGQALSYLGRTHGTRAVVDLADGSLDAGWVGAAAAVECYTWSVRLELETFCTRYAPERARFTVSVQGRTSRGVLLLAHAVAARDARRERELWDLLAKPLAAATDGRIEEWWYQRRFEPFFVTPYASARGLKFPLDLPGPELEGLGVYGPMLARWEDDDAVAAALDAACDYHTKQMFGLSQTYDSEYDVPPFDLVPVEVFAINRLRAATGLREVPVGHPLATCIGQARAARVPAEVLEVIHRASDNFRAFYRK